MSDQGQQITDLVEALMAHTLGLENLDPLREMIARSPAVHGLTDALSPHVPQIQDLATNGRHIVQVHPPAQAAPIIPPAVVHVNVPKQDAPHVHVPAQQPPVVHNHPPSIEGKSGKTKRRIKGTWKGAPIDATVEDG